MANDLAEYQASVLASLLDTGTKYSTTTLNEAIRRALNDYTRAFPDFTTATINLTATSRRVVLTSQTDLITILWCLHPYVSTLTDIYERARHDYVLNWVGGVPVLFFKDNPLPKSGEQLYLEYAKPQNIKDLDSATATTVRLDHKAILVAGAAGFSATIRSQMLNESWGGLPGQMPNLAQWGAGMIRYFHDQLIIIRQELNLNPFTDSKWKLDDWDK
jgi:hypothetical protein